MANISGLKQHKSFNWQYKIAGVDIELREKKFMDDELEYYKSVKTKPKKKVRQDMQK